MARSRESVRENKAMQQILRGETPEKRIMVAIEDINEKKERQKQIVKEANYSQQEFNYILQQNFDNIQETYYKAKEDDNVSAMVGACKTQNSAIRNYVAIKRDLDYPEMWQNAIDNSLQRQSHGDLDQLERYVHPWDKHCKEQDEIPF